MPSVVTPRRHAGTTRFIPIVRGSVNMTARWAASRVPADAVASLRADYCEETGGQILHYSFYIREGWVTCYALHHVDEPAEHAVGYCAVVEAGPWEGKPAVFQFWVEPSDRMATFALFEVACEAAGAVGVATQLNAPLLPALMHAYCVQVTTESIVFEDQHPALRLEAPEGGSQLRSLTSSDDTASAMAKGRGGCEFSLHAADGSTVATGGILFHYNPVRPGGPPYGDIHYEVATDRRGQVTCLKSQNKCVDSCLRVHARRWTDRVHSGVPCRVVHNDATWLLAALVRLLCHAAQTRMLYALHTYI